MTGVAQAAEEMLKRLWVAQGHDLADWPPTGEAETGDEHGNLEE